MGTTFLKFYFHDFAEPRKIKGKSYSYAIVDGKQRLTAIWDFIEGKFPLASDFKYLHDDSVKAGSMKYSDIASNYNHLKIRFDQKSLPIYAIQTTDLELIEDMFSRLNEAVPLNAAEKRNAWPGPLPKVIRNVSKHGFFTSSLPFKNVRYRHFDIATKFLLIERNKGVTDTKKAYLDNLVGEFANEKDSIANSLGAKCTPILDGLESLFTAEDPLLRSVGMVTVYYLLVRDGIIQKWVKKLNRQALVDFEDARAANRIKAEHKISSANYNMLEFDRISQSPNDELAIKFRLGVVRDFLSKKVGI